MITLKKIFITLKKISNLRKKRYQKLFYYKEEFKNKIKLNNKLIYSFNNYFIRAENEIKNNFFTKSVNDKKKVIIRIVSKTKKYFNYFIDGKKYIKSIVPNNLNFVKIDINKAKKIKFLKDKDYTIFKPIFFKKKEKRKLVLLLLVDGLGQDLIQYSPNSKNFFGEKNIFKNVWSNSNWTLPVFGNLITGKYALNHKCYQPETIYNNSSEIRYQCESNLFESFSKLNFVTGCYSPYVRINPTYGSDKGVDIFKYCPNASADELVENIISQLTLFKETSNFIVAHFLDGHGLQKKFARMSESAFFSDKNFAIDENNINKTKDMPIDITHDYIHNKTFKRAIKVESGFDEKEKISLFKFVDAKLQILYSFLNSQNYDDYTILMFGDHGTRLASNIKNKILLANNMANVGFFVKDKKNKFSSMKRNKIIQTVDIFPSLLSRYSGSSSVKKIKDFDGKNTLFSNTKRNFNITEAPYNNTYDIHIRNKNAQLSSKFELKEHRLKKLIFKNYLDTNEKVIKRNNKNKADIVNLDKILNNHIKKFRYF